MTQRKNASTLTPRLEAVLVVAGVERLIALPALHHVALARAAEKHGTRRLAHRVQHLG